MNTAFLKAEEVKKMGSGRSAERRRNEGLPTAVHHRSGDTKHAGREKPTVRGLPGLRVRFRKCGREGVTARHSPSHSSVFTRRLFAGVVFPGLRIFAW